MTYGLSSATLGDVSHVVKSLDSLELTRPQVLRNYLDVPDALHWDNLMRTYGHTKVLLSRDDAKWYRGHTTKEMSLTEYIRSVTNDSECAQNSGGRQSLPLCYELREVPGSDFIRANPEVFEALQLQDLLPTGYRQSMSGRKISTNDQVLWMGRRGALTSLHADVIPGGLLVHLSGRKRVTLFAPDQQEALHAEYRISNREYVSPVDPSLPRELNHRRWPRAIDANPTAVYELSRGDALYIPCGWYHFVEYLTAALSISSFVMADWQYTEQHRCLHALETRLGKRINYPLDEDSACMPYSCQAWASPASLEVSGRLLTDGILDGFSEGEITLSRGLPHICDEPSSYHSASGISTCHSVVCVRSSGFVHKTLFVLPTQSDPCLGVNPRSELAAAFYTAILNWRSARRMQNLASEGARQVAQITSLRLLPPFDSPKASGVCNDAQGTVRTSAGLNNEASSAVSFVGPESRGCNGPAAIAGDGDSGMDGTHTTADLASGDLTERRVMRALGLAILNESSSQERESAAQGDRVSNAAFLALDQVWMPGQLSDALNVEQQMAELQSVWQ